MQGIDQLRPSLGVQAPNPNLPTQYQFLLASQQQAQSNLGNSANLGDMHPRRFSGPPRGSMSAKDVQTPRNEGPISSSLQSSSPKVSCRNRQSSSHTLCSLEILLSVPTSHVLLSRCVACTFQCFAL